MHRPISALLIVLSSCSAAVAPAPANLAPSPSSNQPANRTPPASSPPPLGAAAPEDSSAQSVSPEPLRAESSLKRAPAVRAKLLLKLGSMKTDPEFERLTGALSAASRQALGEIPGVRVLEESEDADLAASKRKPPVVMITGKLCDVAVQPEGEDVVVSAKVEYFVHRMPGQSIAAVVSGSAKTKVAKAQVIKKRLRDKLELDLVAAAVSSAARRTEPALKAAVN